MCGGGRWRDSAGVAGDVRDGNPWVCSHGTHTHEHGYGFHMGVGAGGPNFTHGLPVTSTTHQQVCKPTWVAGYGCSGYRYVWVDSESPTTNPHSQPQAGHVGFYIQFNYI